MLHIVTDAGVDMPVGWKEKYKIHVLPLMIRFGEHVMTSEDFTDSNDFYSTVSEKKIIPKTSLPSPAEVINFYRKIAKKGDTIISIHIARKMSGTFSIVQSVAKELRDEFKVFAFDSGAGSAAQGFMCREASLMINQKLDPESILDRLEAMKARLTLVFTLNTLEYAQMSGRINRLQAAVSSILKIKPIIVLRDGLLQMAEKVRTRQSSLERIVDLVKSSVQDKLVDLAIVHANDYKTASWLADKVKTILRTREIVLTELSLPVAANLGPGTVGIVAMPVNEKEPQ